MLTIRRNGEEYGPYSADEIQHMMSKWQVLSSDTCRIQGTSTWRSLGDVEGLLPSLTGGDGVLYADEDVVLTPTTLWTNGRTTPVREIQQMEVVIPEPVVSRKKGLPWDKIAYWTIGILFIWTLVIPVAIWYITRPNTTEQGLGSFYGIRIHGPFGMRTLKDGIGRLDPADPYVETIRQVAAQLGAAIEAHRRS